MIAHNTKTEQCTHWCRELVKLQFNILDDSLKLCTGFGSFCKRNKFMAWASAGPAEIMNL